MRNSKEDLKPRKGHTLVVAIVARISGRPRQKDVSLEDQEDHAKEVIAELYDGPVEYRVIATKGKGERLDRPELKQIEASLRTREIDVLVVEDIGRLVRGTEAKRLFGIAVDHGTRAISANDGIDTAEDSWEADVISACRDHVGHQTHTSLRIKDKLMKRFERSGGATAREPFGYIKPEGAKTYDDWHKDPAAIPIYQEWFRILKATLNCSAVADWLNSQGVPTGKYCRNKVWDGKLVRQVTRNSLLKGMPARGRLHTVKLHENGSRIPVKNPKGPKYWPAPHLAFWDPADFDELNTLLDRKNNGMGRKPVNGQDPRLRVPRKRTRFPGQHAVCWYCGFESVWGGNGMTGNLMCNHARRWGCWNSIGFNGSLVATKVAAAVAAELSQLDGFDDQLRAIVEETNRVGNDGLAGEWDQLRREEAEMARQKDNLSTGIAQYGPRQMFGDKLAELERKEREFIQRRRVLDRRTGRSLQLPAAAELRTMFEEKVRGLAIDSPEFGDLLNQVAPGVYVYLVRLVDGGRLLPRAKVILSLDGIVPDAVHSPAYSALLRRELTIDLFDPPQRERIRLDAVRLTAEGLDQRQVAGRCDVTPTAVYRALALDRLMREQGLDSPYVLVTEPPADCPKIRRHKNPKYQFKPLEGYQPPPI